MMKFEILLKNGMPARLAKAALRLVGCLALACLLPAGPRAAAQQEVAVSGTIVDPDGNPVPGICIGLFELRLSECCFVGTDHGSCTEDDGAFSYQVNPAEYVFSAVPPTPYDVVQMQIDARGGDRTDLTVQLTETGAAFVPDDPPKASLLQVSEPDDSLQVTVSGLAGSVAGKAFVILVSLDTGHFSWARAEADGSFRGRIFGPRGSSILIKPDPFGSTLIKVMNENFGGGEGNIAPLAGTIVRVPLQAPSDGKVPFGGAGPFERGYLPVWTLQGTIDRQQAEIGESILVEGTLEVISEADSQTQIEAAFPSFILDRLSGPQGEPSIPTSLFASSLLTPTGLPIERLPLRNPFFDVSTVALEAAQPGRLQGAFTANLPIPDHLQPGYYRLRAMVNYSETPALTKSNNMIIVDKASLRMTHSDVYLPVIRVGNPAPPRLFWSLLSDTLSNGSRGTIAEQDRQLYELAPRIMTQSSIFVTPRIDPRTRSPITYRLEPFAPAVSRGDRGLPPPPPGIPFRFPSGNLTVRILRPDGSVQVLGPKPFAQSRLRTLVDRNGRTLDSGGGHLSDIFQLSTMDPEFEVEFDMDGLHRIELEGNLEDIWGNLWSGGGSYQVWAARLLSLDTAVLPGTPFEVGDTFAPGITLQPGVPADIEVRFRLAPRSVSEVMIERTVMGRANRFGLFQPAGGIGLDQPGEYRVDMTASYRDEEGNLWMGSRSWGSAVAPRASPIIAHGRRATDGAFLGPQWFFLDDLEADFGEGHVFLPFHSGDVSWLENDESVRPEVTLQDPQGIVVDLLRQRDQAAGRYADFQERAAAGEIPLFSSRPDTILDPHLDPQKVDLWGYSYRSVQRPLVRVREELTEDGLPSLYWRFDESYAQQFGAGANGDLVNDFKFQYGAAVLHGAALEEPLYSIYGSLFVLVPEGEPAVDSRTFPPFQGNGGGPSGGPIMTLKGREIEIFFHPTALRPGSILQTGDLAALVGHIGPTLPSKVRISVTSPSGTTRQIEGQANKIGYFYNPEADFIVEEPGRYRVQVEVWHDGLTSAGPVQPPFPSGDVLGSTQGEFSFYVVDPGSAQAQVDIPRDSFARPAQDPIQIPVSPTEMPHSVPAGSQAAELSYTTVMPGFILEEGAGADLSYRYDAPRLHRDFPNLDLWDSDGRAGVDTISMSFLLQGPDAQPLCQARQVILQGEELLALPHLAPVDGFAQFGDGQGLSSTLILVNPSPLQKAVGTIDLASAEGSDLEVDVNGSDRSGGFAFETAARGAVFFETDGLGELVTGSARLRSNLALGGTVLFSGDFGVAGVGMARPEKQFAVALESDASRGVETGLAVANAADSPVGLEMALRRADGSQAGRFNFVLPARGQISRFPREIFPGVDFSAFQGSLQVSAAQPVIGMAVRVSPGQFATLPVASPAARRTKLSFAQFGNGEGISSSLILVNPFDEPATATVRLFTDQGSPLSVNLANSAVQGTLSVDLPARGAAILASDGSGELVTGWGEIQSSLPIGGAILFAGDFGVAGVGSAEASRRFLMPVEIDPGQGIETGVALANPQDSEVQATVTLRGLEGTPVSEGVLLTLPARGQLARFPSEIFEADDIGAASFRGTLEARADMPLVGMAIRVSPGEFATLPVTRMN